MECHETTFVDREVLSSLLGFEREETNPSLKVTKSLIAVYLSSRSFEALSLRKAIGPFRRREGRSSSERRDLVSFRVSFSKTKGIGFSSARFGNKDRSSVYFKRVGGCVSIESRVEKRR